MLKILFRKRGDDWVGRFDKDAPISALNPLTNAKIIGEVEFYKIENPFLKIFPVEDRYPRGKTLSLFGLKGTFIGSDYNFQHSEKLRQCIFDNCV